MKSYSVESRAGISTLVFLTLSPHSLLFYHDRLVPCWKSSQKTWGPVAPSGYKRTQAPLFLEQSAISEHFFINCSTTLCCCYSPNVGSWQPQQWTLSSVVALETHKLDHQVQKAIVVSLIRSSGTHSRKCVISTKCSWPDVLFCFVLSCWEATELKGLKDSSQK